LKTHPHVELLEGKGLLFKEKLLFVNERNYKQLHINDGILDIEGQHHTKRIVTKHLD
jgi:hypothetical protein